MAMKLAGCESAGLGERTRRGQEHPAACRTKEQKKQQHNNCDDMSHKIGDIRTRKIISNPGMIPVKPTTDRDELSMNRMLGYIIKKICNGFHR
jgi:hypothetical protein